MIDEGGKKKLGLGRFIQAGRAQGQALRHGNLRGPGVPTTLLDDARVRLDEAHAHAARGGLAAREWVMITVRGLERLLDLDDPRVSTLLEEAVALKRKVLAEDEREFAALRKDLREGRFTPADWRAALADMTDLERDAFTGRLLRLQDPPRSSRAREDGMVHFVASTVRDVLEVADLVDKDDVFYDVGCGTGRVALLVRWLTGATVKGIEYDGAYVESGKAAQAELGIDVELIEGDARAFTYEDATVIYAYEPFRGDIMHEFLERLRTKTKPFTLLSRFVVEDGMSGVSWLELAETRPSGLRRYVPRTTAST